MVTFERSPTRCAASCTSSHWLGRHLVGTDDRAHLVVEDLRRRPGQGAEAEIAQPREVRLEIEPERRRALPDLERRERVHVDPWHRRLDRRHDGRVVLACERRVDPALEADLGRAALPRLAHPPDDLVLGDEVGRASEVLGELALRERAEPTAEVADVRVLDVPRDDVRDLVAAGLAPQRVGRREDALPLGTAGGEEADELLLAQLLTHDSHRHRVAPDDERHRDRLAGRPAVLAGEPVGVGRPPDRGSDGRVRPAVEVGDVLGVERQPWGELEPAGATRLAQALDVRPRRLGVDVIRRDGRDAAPVVDARVEQDREVVVGEVRRRLHVHLRAEQDPRDGDRPEVLLERRVGMLGHPRARLRAEVLDDHLAQVPVLVGKGTQREQRVDPLLPRLADPDQDPARERDRELAREAHRLEPARRHLVGGGPVRAAPGGEPPGGRLEHDPHRRGDGPQQDQLVARHHSRVQVRQEPGLVEHQSCTAGEVLERRLTSERCELLPRDAVAGLGPVAEREERLGAASVRPGSGDREHLVLGQIGALAAPRRPRERAIAADVAAERRQRDEDLRRVRDERPGALRTKTPRLGHEVGERRAEKLGDAVCHRRWVVAGRSPRAGVGSIRKRTRAESGHGSARRDPRAAPRRG